MRATVCGHHVRQRNDEKLADLRSKTLILWDKSPSPPRSVVRREKATSSACFPSSAATVTIGAAAAARDPIRKLAKATVAAAVAAVIDAYRA